MSLRDEGTHPVNYAFIGLIFEVTGEGRGRLTVGSLENLENSLVTIFVELPVRFPAHAIDKLVELISVDLVVKVEFGETGKFQDYRFVPKGYVCLIGVHVLSKYPVGTVL